MIRFLAVELEQTAELHQLASKRSSDKRLRSFASQAAEKLKHTAQALTRDADRRAETLQRADIGDSSIPDLSETVREIATSIERRAKERGQERTERLPRRSSAPQGESLDEASRERQGQQDAQNDKSLIPVLQGEDREQEPVRRALIEHLPEILELVTEAIENDASRADPGWMAFLSDSARREKAAQTELLNRLKGTNFDRLYLHLALSEELELLSMFEAVQAGEARIDSTTVSGMLKHLTENRGRIRELSRGVSSDEADAAAPETGQQ